MKQIAIVIAILLVASTALAQPAPFDPAIVDTLVNGLKNHAVAAIVASLLSLAVIGAHRVESIKAIWDKLPGKARLLWPIGITIVSSVADALLSGKPWVNSLILSFMLNGYAILYIATSPADATPKPGPLSLTLPKITMASLVLACALLFAPGCSIFRTACDKAMPVLVQGQAYGTDATNAISSAESLAKKLPLSATQLAALSHYLDIARAGVEIGSVSLATAANMCNAQSPVEAFGEFIAAWGEIEKILGGGSLMASPGRPALYTPAVVKLARAHK